MSRTARLPVFALFTLLACGSMVVAAEQTTAQFAHDHRHRPARCPASPSPQLPAGRVVATAYRRHRCIRARRAARRRVRLTFQLDAAAADGGWWFDRRPFGRETCLLGHRDGPSWSAGALLSAPPPRIVLRLRRWQVIRRAT